MSRFWLWIHRCIEKSLSNRNATCETVKEKYQPAMLGGLSKNHRNTHGVQDFPQEMNFSVFSARGGLVLQRSTYDMASDRHTQTLYVISDTSEDQAKEIGEIVSLEMMRS